MLSSPLDATGRQYSQFTIPAVIKRTPPQVHSDLIEAPPIQIYPDQYIIFAIPCKKSFFLVWLATPPSDETSISPLKGGVPFTRLIAQQGQNFFLATTIETFFDFLSIRKPMIKLNLTYHHPIIFWPTFFRAANLGLGLLLLVQLTMIGWRLMGGLGSDDRILALKTQIKELDEKHADLFAKAADVVALAGALQDRNDWISARASSPIMLLGRFETTKPDYTFLISFQGSKTSGSVRMTALDLETAQDWLKAALGDLNGSLTVEEQTSEGTQVVYSWNK